MRVRSIGLVLSLLLAACGSSSPSGDGGGVGTDATSPLADAGPADSGLFGVMCGSSTCDPTQFCHVRPTGPCAPSDGGACSAGMEACTKGGVAGCTSPETRSCEALPPGCASCGCLIPTDPCPSDAGALADCRKLQGQGVTVTCPFP